ncbi:MAG: (dimethylallyl)adenosine tRNA methylthiotransferase MiaB [Actinomycetota bacterium]
MLKHEARIGRIEDVLIEGPSRRNPVVYQARTRQNKVVHFTPTEPIRTGSYGLVEITSAAPHHLRGVLVEVTADPSHKVRIPVASL